MPLSAPAIIYIRFSTKKQEAGFSRERQLEDCQTFCAAHGLDIVEIVEDLGRSAWSGEHLESGNLGKLTSRIKQNEIPAGTTLVVEKLDRLSRQEPRKAHRWIEDVIDKGIRIASVDGARFFDSAMLSDQKTFMATTFEILFGAQNSNEHSEKLSGRLLDAWSRKKREAKQTGRAMTSMVPAWITVAEDKAFGVVEERAAVVRWIYEQTAAGVGSWTIANMLNERGIHPWGSKRKDNPANLRGWNHTYVRWLLQTAAVEGEHHLQSYRHKKRVATGDVIENYFPRIVDADLVARARSAMASRAKTSGGRFASYGRNLFAGIAFCRHCNSRMILTGRGVHSEKEAYLQCDGAKKRKGCTNRSCFDYKALEASVLKKMLSLALSESHFSQPDQTASLTLKVAEIDKSLSNRKAEISRLIRMAARFDDTTEFDNEIMRVQQEARRLEISLTEAKDELLVAKGKANPEEHARRVLEVNDALQSADPEVMQDARRRVAVALRETITRIECSAQPVEGKKKPFLSTLVMMADGAIRYKFDKEGNLLEDIDHLNEQPAIILNERDYEAEEARRLRGDNEFAANGQYRQLWKRVRIEMPASEAFVEGFKHDNPEQARRIDNIVTRRRR